MSTMLHVHLAGEDEDDMYGGFNDYNATLDTVVSFCEFYDTYDSGNHRLTLKSVETL